MVRQLGYIMINDDGCICFHDGFKMNCPVSKHTRGWLFDWQNILWMGCNPQTDLVPILYMGDVTYNIYCSSVIRLADLALEIVESPNSASWQKIEGVWTISARECTMSCKWLQNTHLDCKARFIAQHCHLSIDPTSCWWMMAGDCLQSGSLWFMVVHAWCSVTTST